MNKNKEIIGKIIKVHSEQPDKDLKEIFKECAENLSEEERKVFYKKLKEIVN